MKLAVSQHVLATLGVVVGLLVLATVIVALLRRARPERDLTELSLRVRSWWVMIGIFTLALVLSRLVSLLFFCLLSVLAFREYLQLVPPRSSDRRVVLWAFIAIVVQYGWIAWQWYGMFIIWIPVFAFLLLPLRMVLIGETEGFVRAAGTLHWGLMMAGFSVSHLAALLVLPGTARPDSPVAEAVGSGGGDAGAGAALLLFVVFLAQFNDVAQYCWGKLLGRRPVLPRVSPKKTIEGLLGGIATTVLASWLLAPWLTPLGPGQSLAAGVLISLGGFVGDVVISALKRDLGAKDSGELIPGHGGILDRLDSLTYAAPLFFHFVRYLHY